MNKPLHLLLLFPLLSFGQSKKDLKARIYLMQVDSANQVELVGDLQEAITEMEQTIVSQTRTLKDAQNDIASMYSRISELNKQLKESEETISSLENEVFNLTLEKEMLQVQLDSALNALSIEAQNHFNGQEPLDFEFDYEKGAIRDEYWVGGYRSTEVYPVGWSYDGIIAYVGDVNNDNLSVGSSSICIVKDMKTNTVLEQIEIATGELSSKWVDSDFLEFVTDAVASYDIIPLGFGQLNPSNHIKRPGPIGVDIYITLEKSGDRYRIFDDGNYHQSITSGSLESYTMDGEIFCKPDVEYVGHIVSPIGNYAAMILMHKQPCHWEGEINYYPEFIGFKLE